MVAMRWPRLGGVEQEDEAQILCPGQMLNAA